jgi:hypothetical protein
VLSLRDTLFAIRDGSILYRSVPLLLRITRKDDERPGKLARPLVHVFLPDAASSDASFQVAGETFSTQPK